MSKKESFIKLVELLMNETKFNWDDEKWEDAHDFWNALKVTEDNEKPAFTENGKLILNYLRENKELYNNLFKAKDVGEGLSISSRTVSGGMRKLVTDEYVEKVGANPIVYSLTTKGMEADLTI